MPTGARALQPVRQLTPIYRWQSTRATPRLVAQLPTQQLAHGCLRQLVARLEIARHLVAGEVLPAMLEQRLLVGRIVLEADEDLHCLTLARIRYADRHAFTHGDRKST